MGEDNTFNCKTYLPLYLSEDVLLYPIYKKLRFVLLSF